MSLLTLNFPSDQNFEPSSQTKEKLLYTHKTAKQFAGISIPGLFQTTNHTLHLILFFLIFVLEAAAVVFSEDAGVYWPAILSAILIDIVFAVLSHLPHKEIVRGKNLLLLSNGIPAINIQRRIQRLRWRQYIFYFFLFLSATFKIYLLWDVVGDGFNPIVLFSMLVYAIAAVLHISISGYALFGVYVSIWLNRDYQEFLKKGGAMNFYDTENPLRYYFESKLELVPCSVRNQKLVKLGPNKYQLETFGILTDADLVSLITQQRDQNQMREVIIEGVRHQLTVLLTNPNQGQTTSPNQN